MAEDAGWKARLRDLVGATLAAAGATRPGRQGHDHLWVMTFHRVLPEALRRAYPYPDLALTPEELDWMLAFFAEHFECGPLAATAEAWRRDAGAKAARPRLALTFDDGQRDNLSHAHPVLAARGLHASFFVVTDAADSGAPLWHDRLGYALAACVGQGPAAVAALLTELGASDLDVGAPSTALAETLVERAKGLTPGDREAWLERARHHAGGDAGGSPDWDAMLTWKELAELAAAGHEIGSHSRSHPLLPECSATQLEAEVAGSRARIAERLGVPPVSFCYPNGSFDRRCREAVARAGYAQAVGTGWGVNPPGADLFGLARCDMIARHTRGADGRLSAARLAWRLSGRHPGLGREELGG